MSTDTLSPVHPDPLVSEFLATALSNGFRSITVQGSPTREYQAAAVAAGVILISFTHQRTKLSPGCGLWLADGSDVPCKVAALDDLGNWSTVTEDGRTVQYLASEIR